MCSSYRVKKHADGQPYALGAFPSPAERRKRRAYAPLAETPELFLEFARLADRDITQDVWLDWLHRHGVLGHDRTGKSYRAWWEGGPGETLSRFREEALRAHRVLTLFEAATVGYVPDVPAIAEHMPEHLRRCFTEPPERAGEWMPPEWATLEWAGEWALEYVATLVQEKLVTECYPQLYWTPDGFPNALGFGSLLGAMYLQMMWLMAPTSKVRYCKAPGCSRVITFDQPEQPPELTGTGAKKKRRTYSNKQFCSDRCRVRYHYHARKARSKAL